MLDLNMNFSLTVGMNLEQDDPILEEKYCYYVIQMRDLDSNVPCETFPSKDSV